MTNKKDDSKKRNYRDNYCVINNFSPDEEMISTEEQIHDDALLEEEEHIFPIEK